MTTVVKEWSWTPVSEELIEDAPELVAFMEYAYTVKGTPLTLRERLSGRRTFVASNGVVLPLDVSWRWRLHRLQHPDIRYRLRMAVHARLFSDCIGDGL